MIKKIIFIFGLLLFALLNSKHVLAVTQPTAPRNAEQMEAVITKVIEQSEIIEDTGNKHPYQKLSLIGTSGRYKGKNFIIENGKYDQTGIVTYKIGDKVVVSVQKDGNGKDLITISDYVRRTPLYILFAIFIILAIVVARKRGVTSLLGMALSFGIIFIFVLPQILNGQNPILITVIAALFIIPITFSLSHGFNRKTLCAVAGTLIALLLTGILAAFFVNASHLSGFASEETGYLEVIKHGSIDIKGLLFAGIIIGLLGVLQDITISQSAIIFQLNKANPNIKFRELYSRAMDVGSDHIASMANTLILVYAGASLPLLLLFLNNPLPFTSIINFEIIAEEIVRTLVASIGLIIAVPITTLLTALFVEFTKAKNR